MSLQHVANHLAQQGRGNDSMLVHMTPSEVAGLRSLAHAKGGDLTINPHTGLPEAGFLDDVIKVAAPLALGAFLGPAGMGLSAGMAGAAVGGIATLATGSLSRGLMAGLGAYGGAGLAEGFMGAGANTIGQTAAPAALDAAGTVAGQTVMDNMGNFITTPTVANVGDEALAAHEAATNAVAKAGPIGTAGAGIQAAYNNPSDFVKQMGGLGNVAKYGVAAVAPIMADKGVQTTTAPPVDTGYIRQKVFDPVSQQYITLAPVKAKDWGSRSFSDIYQQPTTAATGGIVALAQGGAIPRYEDGGPISSDVASQIASAYQAGDYGAVNEALAANQITQAQAAQQWGNDIIANVNPIVSFFTPSGAPAGGGAPVGGVAAPAGGVAAPAGVVGGLPTVVTANPYTSYTADQYASFFADPKNAAVLQSPGSLAAAEAQFNADPNAVNKYLAGLTSGYYDPTATQKGSGTLNTYQQLMKENLSPAVLAAAEKAVNPDWGKTGYWNQDTLSKAYDVANKVLQFDPLTDKVTPSDKQWVAFMDQNKLSAKDISIATGLTEKEVQDRYNAAKNAPVTPIVPNIPIGIPTNATAPVPGTGNVTKTVLPTNPGTNAPTGTSNPYGNPNTPGDITKNADGTITVHPNVPGEPYGGFSGVGEVKNAWTAGGGSTGYFPPAPKTAAEAEKQFNTMTGDSLAAYNFLMGKGTQPLKTTAAQVSRPYREAVMGLKPAAVANSALMPKIFNPVTHQIEDNPAYKASTATGTSGAAPTLGTKTISIPVANGTPPRSATQIADYPGYYFGADGKYYDAKGNLVANTADEFAIVHGANGGLMSMATGGMAGYALGGLGSLGGYSDGGRLLRGPGDGVSDSIPASIGNRQPARLADGEFVVPARIVSEIGNGSTEAGARKLYQMMDRVQNARAKTTGKGKVAKDTNASKYLPV